MEPVTNAQKKAIAEKLFLQGEAQKDIAVLLEVSEKTVGTWKEKGRWHDLRAATTVTADHIVRGLIEDTNLILETAQREHRAKTAKETDAVVKNAKAIQMLQRQVSLATAMPILKRFSSWLVERDPKLASALTEPMRDFLYTLAADD